MHDFATIWPLHDLQLITPRLLLRPVRDEDLAPLSAAASAGIHEPDRMPFVVPWTRQTPEQLALATVQNVWRQRASLSVDDWTVSFAVYFGEELIGRQDVRAASFPERRTVDSGSWLTSSRQGQGLGKEMRAAVLLWAFDHLSAEYATTAAMAWNQASQGVSRSLGYRPNGVDVIRTDPGESQESHRFRLTRADFRRPEWQLRTEGHEAVTRFLGLS